jgi:hypothetical protein
MFPLVVIGRKGKGEGYEGNERGYRDNVKEK